LSESKPFLLEYPEKPFNVEYGGLHIQWKPPREIREAYMGKVTTYLVQVRPIKPNEHYFQGAATGQDDGWGGYDIVHTAPQGVNKRVDFPVIIGEMYEDDEGNVEYEYYPVKNDTEKLRILPTLLKEEHYEFQIEAPGRFILTFNPITRETYIAKVS